MSAGAKLDGQLCSDWKYTECSVSFRYALARVMLGGSLLMVECLYLIPWMISVSPSALLSSPSSLARSARAL